MFDRIPNTPLPIMRDLENKPKKNFHETDIQ